MDTTITTTPRTSDAAGAALPAARPGAGAATKQPRPGTRQRPDAGSPATPPGAAPTIAVACLAVVMLMLDISVINTALSEIASGLNTGLGGLQWVIDAYTLPLAATVLTAGALADKLGRRRMFLVGLGIFTAFSAICALAGSIEVLVAARAIQGLGAAILFATGLALIAHVSPTPEARAKALAAFGAAIGAAFAIGPFIGGGLTELLGWRAIFAINVPFGILAFWLAARSVQESRDPNARRVDWSGQLCCIAGMFLLVLGLVRGNEDGWGSTGVVLALGGSVACLAAFAAIQTRSEHPMLPLGLLRQPRFAGPQLAVFGISASFFALFLYATLYLQTVLGLSPIQTGLVYLPGTALIFVASALSAQLLGRTEPAVLAVAGLGLVAVGLCMLLTTGVDSSWTVVQPGLLVTCLGTGLFNPAGSALALQALPDHQAGLASGANDLFRQTGVAVGLAALGTFVPAAAALGGDPQGYVDGFHHAIIASASIAAVAALGTAALLLRPGVRRAQSADARA